MAAGLVSTTFQHHSIRYLLIALKCRQACITPLLLGRYCSIVTQEAMGCSAMLVSNSFWNFFSHSSLLCSAYSFHSVFLSFFPKFLSCSYRVQILCEVLETERCTRVLGLWECSLNFCGMIPHAKFMKSFCSGFERSYSSSYSNIVI